MREKLTLDDVLTYVRRCNGSDALNIMVEDGQISDARNLHAQRGSLPHVLTLVGGGIVVCGDVYKSILRDHKSELAIALLSGDEFERILAKNVQEEL